MNSNFEIVQFGTADEFLSVVRSSHHTGGFRGDAHSMNHNFKLAKSSVGFVAISFNESVSKEVMGFICYDIIETRNYGLIGEIKNLGVLANFRRQGLATQLVSIGENISKESFPSLSKIKATCNPDSAIVMVKNGHIIINEGRVTSTGKICLIGTEKILG